MKMNEEENIQEEKSKNQTFLSNDTKGQMKAEGLNESTSPQSTYDLT